MSEQHRKEPSALTIIAAVVIGLIIWFLALRGLADLGEGRASNMADFERERE